jgi:membrane protease YdiL (CAAX protease family)
MTSPLTHQDPDPDPSIPDPTSAHRPPGRVQETAGHDGSGRPARPGWPEIIIGLIAYGVSFLLVFLILHAIPDELSVLSGVIELMLSGLMGLAASAVAVLIRIRGLAAFGFRRVEPKWLLIGAASGVGAWLVGTVYSTVVTLLTGPVQTVQGDYQAAAGGGVLAVILTILMGAVLTPIGEESFFRGVIANALQRYSPWVCVIGSAAIFAVCHGINAVTPVAFIVGVGTALLFRRTGSVWPGVMLHALNNLAASFVPLLIVAMM